jgi:hypothetical protein
VPLPAQALGAAASCPTCAAAGSSTSSPARAHSPPGASLPRLSCAAAGCTAAGRLRPASAGTTSGACQTPGGPEENVPPRNTCRQQPNKLLRAICLLKSSCPSPNHVACIPHCIGDLRAILPSSESAVEECQAAHSRGQRPPGHMTRLGHLHSFRVITPATFGQPTP